MHVNYTIFVYVYNCVESEPDFAFGTVQRGHVQRVMCSVSCAACHVQRVMCSMSLHSCKFRIYCILASRFFECRCLYQRNEFGLNHKLVADVRLVHKYACTHTYMHIYIHAYTHTNTCTCMHTCIRTCTHTHNYNHACI